LFAATSAATAASDHRPRGQETAGGRHTMRDDIKVEKDEVFNKDDIDIKDDVIVKD
jgi:hypothetical protein